MQIINWLQVFCSHLCKWLLLPFITASFSTCLSISPSWGCQNNISVLCCLWSDGAQMKAQAEGPHNSSVASQVCDAAIWDARYSLGFWHFWKTLWKVPNTTHCCCAGWTNYKQEVRNHNKSSALIFAGTEGKKDGWIYTGLLNTMLFMHTRHRAISFSRPNSCWLKGSWQPHTHRTGPRFTKYSYSISLFSDSGVLYSQDPMHQVFSGLCTEGNGCHLVAWTVSSLRYFLL